MKKAKRIISILCAAILSLGCITACDEEPQNPSNPQSGVEQEGGQTPQNPSPETPAPETPSLKRLTRSISREIETSAPRENA